MGRLGWCFWSALCFLVVAMDFESYHVYYYVIELSIFFYYYLVFIYCYNMSFFLLSSTFIFSTIRQRTFFVLKDIICPNGCWNPLSTPRSPLLNIILAIPPPSQQSSFCSRFLNLEFFSLCFVPFIIVGLIPIRSYIFLFNFYFGHMSCQQFPSKK